MDNKTIYFGIGAHPGFNLPLTSEEAFEDYAVEILPRANRAFIPVTKDVLLDLDKIEMINTAKIPLTHELFAKGVLIFQTKGSTTVRIFSTKTTNAITFTYAHMPYLGLWSPYPQAAPFICIEPWRGVADTATTDGELTKKFGINQLHRQQAFSTSYSMKFE